MTSIRTSGAESQPCLRRSRFVDGLMMVVLVELSALTSALADPPKPAEVFAHKYVALDVLARESNDPVLMLRAPSFRTLIDTQPSRIPGTKRQGLIDGIHQGAKAVAVGAAAGQPVRFECSPEGRVVLWVGNQSLVTGLLAAQARPMASVVETGNNGLVTLTDPDNQNGKRGYKSQIAGPYLDTQEGYWLLWADAIAEDLFYRTDFSIDDFPDGLTIVDATHPVTIASDDTTLEVRGGEPWVAFWRYRGGKRARIVRYDDFGRVMKPRDEDDVRAVEAVQRVFKWAPVMRLAAESAPAHFRAFVRQLEQVPITAMTTPRLIIEE
jgi:hypothetical protein